MYDMLATVVKQSDSETDEGSAVTGVEVLQRESTPSELTSRQQAIKKKIQFICKMAKMQRTLREQRESILAIKQMNDNKLPQGLLLEGKDAIDRFLGIKASDSVNEGHPHSFDLESTGHLSSFDMSEKDYSSYFDD